MRWNILLLIVIYVLAFLSGFIFGANYVASISMSKATVYAAAVLSSGGGTLAEVTAEVRPGSGRVFLTVNPKSELDTQESAEIAASVAARLAGKILPVYDISFVIDAPSVIVGGPSAGAAMTVAAYAALTGKTPRSDVVVTGEILPDGRIGPVGGLVDKLEACADHWIKYFLIPKGERYVRVPISVSKKYSPAPGVVVVERSLSWKTVDLVELGKEKGVTVVEVSRIDDVLPYFFS